MKLEQLHHLIAIVEHGSLRAAARRLDMPQPALTRSVRALERELGVSLFARQTTGMVLTAEGVRFHRRACAIANEARRAVEEVQQPGPAYEGTVSVALSIMPHLGMLPDALPVFRRTYPKVKLNITESLMPAVEGALREAIRLKDRTVFLDVRTDPTENVWPMVQAGKGITEMLLGSEEL